MVKKVFKVILSVLVTYVLLVGIASLVGVLVKDGHLQDAWFSLISYLPFGKPLASFCVNLFTDTLHMGSDTAQYLEGIEQRKILDFFHDSCVLILTAVFFEAVNAGLQKILGVKKKAGFQKVVFRLICGIVSALLCTSIATVLLKTFSQLQFHIPGVLQGLLSLIVSAAAMAGTVSLTTILLGLSMSAAILFVLFKVLLVNILKVEFTYITMLMILLILCEGAYLKLFAVFAGWGFLILGLIFVDILVSQVLEK